MKLKTVFTLLVCAGIGVEHSANALSLDDIKQNMQSAADRIALSLAPGCNLYRHDVLRQAAASGIGVTFLSLQLITAGINVASGIAWLYSRDLPCDCPIETKIAIAATLGAVSATTLCVKSLAYNTVTKRINDIQQKVDQQQPLSNSDMQCIVGYLNADISHYNPTTLHPLLQSIITYQSLEDHPECISAILDNLYKCTCSSITADPALLAFAQRYGTEHVKQKNLIDEKGLISSENEFLDRSFAQYVTTANPDQNSQLLASLLSSQAFMPHTASALHKKLRDVPQEKFDYLFRQLLSRRYAGTPWEEGINTNKCNNLISAFPKYAPLIASELVNLNQTVDLDTIYENKEFFEAVNKQIERKATDPEQAFTAIIRQGKDAQERFEFLTNNHSTFLRNKLIEYFRMYSDWNMSHLEYLLTEHPTTHTELLKLAQTKQPSFRAIVQGKVAAYRFYTEVNDFWQIQNSGGN